MSDMNTGPMETVRDSKDDLVTFDKDRAKLDQRSNKDAEKMENKADKDRLKAKDADVNPDPITGAPGAHPVGTGLGAAGGAAAGALGGAMVGGPVGFAAGGVVGAVVGGLAGKGVAEKVDPTVEDKYWRENYSKRTYAGPEVKYEKLQPAYKYGWEARAKHDGKQWTDVEPDLQAGWNKDQDSDSLSWDEARPATKDAWDRLDRDDQGDGVK